MGDNYDVMTFEKLNSSTDEDHCVSHVKMHIWSLAYWIFCSMCRSEQITTLHIIVSNKK